jgi:3-oxoacyl-[acyl-carrier protein] reductase
VQKRTTAIVTGSGRGIGKETAVLLARKGVNVVVCSRTYSDVRSVVEEIEKLTSKDIVLGIKCDVGVPSQVYSLIRSTLAKFVSETIDILLNNAGVAFNTDAIIYHGCCIYICLCNDHHCLLITTNRALGRGSSVP